MKKPTINQRMADPAWRDQTFRRWHSFINMDHSDLTRWIAHDWKTKASLSAKRASGLGIYSGLRSLRNIARKRNWTQDQWTRREYTEAVRENSFNARMLGVEPGRPISKDIPVSKWEIALRNWGHDPRQTNSPAYRRLQIWTRRYFPTVHRLPSGEEVFFERKEKIK